MMGVLAAGGQSGTSGFADAVYCEFCHVSTHSRVSAFTGREPHRSYDNILQKGSVILYVCLIVTKIISSGPNIANDLFDLADFLILFS